MIFAFPAAGGIVECAQQFLPANLAFHNLGQERAALSFTKELIDVAEQAFRQQDMGALLYHVTAPLRVDQHTLAESAHQSSPKRILRPITSFMSLNTVSMKMLYQP